MQKKPPTETIRSGKVKRKNRYNDEISKKKARVKDAYQEMINDQSKDKERTLNTDTSSKKLTVQEVCDLIAELSESILEDPEQAFTATDILVRDGDSLNTVPKGPSKIRQILNIAGQQESEAENYTSQLAIMSLLAIFKDILPAYRIRVPTATEMAVKVSKDTKKLWDHERSLLQHYQSYLKLLEQTWENRKKSSPHSSVAVTSAMSLAELLKTAFHFNFRSNLLTAVIRQMNNSQSESVSKACCEAIEFVFQNDAQGEVALEATRQVAKLVKDRGLNVKPAVLRTFLSLPLRVHVDEAEAAKLATQVNAKKRRRDKEMAEIESELREGLAGVDKIVLARCQSDMLQAVILTYFRVLKSDNLKASHIEHLLPPSLEGLAKFSHLINIDTVMDLLGVLKDLMKTVENLPLEASLNCVLTSFQTLQGPGRELKIDQKEYIMPLYSQLPRLCLDSNSLKHTETMLKCLTSAFIKRREYSTVRTASFLKQIFTTAMHTPAHTAIPLLAFARQLLQRYPSGEQMLENEQDVITSGEYTPNVEDPELTNAFATSAWELATLKFHLNSGIADQALAAASMKMLQLPGESPEKLRSAQLKLLDDFYVPYKRIKKKHPLSSRQALNADAKQKQIRFIKPRDFQSKFAEDQVGEHGWIIFKRNTVLE